MPKNDDTPVGAPTWIDIFTSDTDKTIAFYGELFGWTCEDAGEDFGHYLNFSLDGVPVAGGMKKDAEFPGPDVWQIYLRTDDAKQTVDDAVAQGGQAVVFPMDVADLGTMLVVTDPDGAAIAGWQVGTFPGFGVLDEPGAPSWFELHTRGYDTAVAFYRDVFHFDAHTAADEPGFRYTTYGEGDNQRAGIMDAADWLPEDVPSHWAVYFHTVDADATIARAVGLGATVIQPAETTPYGRLATLLDSTGTLFKLRQPPA